jgi:uncharacterized protein with HEPN domain
MPRDARTYLWDARHAAELILRFIEGTTFADYQADDLVRSAVERQFEIVGEALNQLSRVDPGLASKIDDLPRLVAFRNILIQIRGSRRCAGLGRGHTQAARSPSSARHARGGMTNRLGPRCADAPRTPSALGQVAFVPTQLIRPRSFSPTCSIGCS